MGKNSASGNEVVAKPFSYPELRARMAAVLRRSGDMPGTGRMRVGPLVVDPLSRRAWLDVIAIHLSKKEFGLLRMLASAPTRTFTREELLRDVWGFRAPGATTRTLDSHAHRLRRKLGGAQVAFVINVWGVGYRLIDPEGVA